MKLLCFEQEYLGVVVPAVFEDVKKAYYGFVEGEPGLWLFTTPAISSRVVETDRICVQVTVEV